MGKGEADVPDKLHTFSEFGPRQILICIYKLPPCTRDSVIMKRDGFEAVLSVNDRNGVSIKVVNV